MLTNDVVSFEQLGPGCSKLEMSLVNETFYFQMYGIFDGKI